MIEHARASTAAGEKRRRDHVWSADVVVRRAESSDVEPALRVWSQAHTARDSVRTAQHQARARVALGNADIVLVADHATVVVGMGLATAGRAQDGAGPVVAGLGHISVVCVAPTSWGQDIGGRIVNALLTELRAQGYRRAPFRTEAANTAAQRMYERHGFQRTGGQRAGLNDLIVHYQRPL